MPEYEMISNSDIKEFNWILNKSVKEGGELMAIPVLVMTKDYPVWTACIVFYPKEK